MKIFDRRLIEEDEFPNKWSHMWVERIKVGSIPERADAVVKLYKEGFCVFDGRVLAHDRVVEVCSKVVYGFRFENIV